MQSFNIPDYAMVKRVNGSKDNPIHKLSFKKKDGTEITKVETPWNASPYGQESVIADDEEIIGVFGTKDVDNHVYKLGFIVWKPPRI